MSSSRTLSLSEITYDVDYNRFLLLFDELYETYYNSSDDCPYYLYHTNILN